MDLHNARTGEFVRELTVSEAQAYLLAIKSASPEGIVCGSLFGVDFPVYALD